MEIKFSGENIFPETIWAKDLTDILAADALNEIG